MRYPKLTIAGGLFGLFALTAIVAGQVSEPPQSENHSMTAEQREQMFPMNDDAVKGCELQFAVTTGGDEQVSEVQCTGMRRVVINAEPNNALQHCTMSGAQLYARYHSDHLPTGDKEQSAIFTGCTMMLFGMPMKAALGAWVAAKTGSNKKWFPDQAAPVQTKPNDDLAN
jgi:hypothetical protein